MGWAGSRMVEELVLVEELEWWEVKQYLKKFKQRKNGWYVKSTVEICTEACEVVTMGEGNQRWLARCLLRWKNDLRNRKSFPRRYDKFTLDKKVHWRPWMVGRWLARRSNVERERLQLQLVRCPKRGGEEMELSERLRNLKIDPQKVFWKIPKNWFIVIQHLCGRNTANAAW